MIRTLAIALISLTAGVSSGQAQQAPLAARDLQRGATLQAADILLAEGDATEFVGWVTRRVIKEGEALQPPAIAPANVIRSGDRVQLVWRQGTMEIRMTGKAMSSAASGEKVLVRVDTQRRFEGIAHAPGEVRLASSETK